MVDVTDATFDQDVVERSQATPVVVDLWAPWCGPCTQLGPLLEEAVAATEGQVVLAKVNVDDNPQVSQAFQVQGIPAVYALKKGKVVDGFVGAQGRDAVEAFVQALLPTAEEGRLAALVAAGDVASLRQALELAPGDEQVIAALADALVTEGEPEEALDLLARVPESAETRRIAARARTGAAPAGDDVDTRLDDLLDRAPGDQEARQEMLDLLELLGPEDPRTARYRKALTSRLF
ncbi:MAG TPA: tetratricopeptide repeat protein [Acidimicrobiales bacterium]|nr:tetratricopeptide repeat protein [Acidimicrobiales bacterium]